MGAKTVAGPLDRAERRVAPVDVLATTAEALASEVKLRLSSVWTSCATKVEFCAKTGAATTARAGRRYACMMSRY